MTYEPAEIRAAFHKAADHIENEPRAYDFQVCEEPSLDCGTPACMWGWVGHFLGVPPHAPYTMAVTEAVGHDWYEVVEIIEGGGDAADNAVAAAIALRKFADLHFPPESSPNGGVER